MRFEVWSDFNARFELSKKLQLNVEPGYRIEPETGIQTGYLRGTLRYSPGRLVSLDFGLANFNVWDAGNLNSHELRTFQFVFLNWPELWDFNFKLRVGLEQRWFDFSVLEKIEFVHRARFRLGVSSPYFDFWEGKSKLYFTANYEILRDVNQEMIDVLVDENRLMFGLGFLDNKNFRGELQYQLIGFRDRNIGELLGDTNLIRLRAYYYFNRR